MDSKGEKRDEQSELGKLGVGDAIDWLEEVMMK